MNRYLLAGLSLWLAAGFWGCDYFPEGLLRPADAAIDVESLAQAAVDLSQLDQGTVDLSQLDQGTVDTAVAGAESGVPAGWWSVKLSKRHKLTFDNGARAANLDGFPVLVVLGASWFDYASAGLNGADLRFVDADNKTQLPHEIESWTKGGTSYVWVRVPRIDASSTTDHIWLYYGATAPPADSKASVWSGYAAVWHLEDHKDATTNNNHGTAFKTTAAQGKIAGGQRFTAANLSSVSVTNSPSLAGPWTVFTMTAWAYRQTNQTNWNCIVSRAHLKAGQNDFWLGFQGGAAIASIWTPSGYIEPKGQPISTGTWYHLAAVYDGAMVRLYVDGKPDAKGKLAQSGTIPASTNPVYLGADVNKGGSTPDFDWIDGVLDEVRLAPVARPAAWIDAQHASMTNKLVSYSQVEKLP